MRTKLCAKCQKVIESPKTYCDDCSKKMESIIEERKRKGNQIYNRNRDKKYTSFYNSGAWRRMSKAYLSKHFLCEECEKEKVTNNKYVCQISEEVHHIVPIQTIDGWNRRFDPNNLIALCHFHHDLKHNRFCRKK